MSLPAPNHAHPDQAPRPAGQTEPARLFTPFQLRDVIIRNRIVVSPMCTYSAVDGAAQDWHLVHLGARAVGGAGLVFAEATAVAPEGRISPDDLGLWDDRHIAPLARIASFIASQGAVPAIQLAHAGRKGSNRSPFLGGGRLSSDQGGWTTVAPSPLPFAPEDPPSLALDAAGITAVTDAFAAAARRAVAAGFLVIEIHAAHGYLLHQFLSPLSNHRSDQHGGSLANRLRVPLAVAEAVRAVVPSHLPVFVRVSATDWIDGGWDVAQTIAFAQELKHRGVDVIDVSSGGSSPKAVVPLAPGYQVAFAQAIRREASIPTGAVGLITAPAQAESILTAGSADLIFLGRAFLREPQWPLSAAAALGSTVAWPPPYSRAAPPPRL
ncbi:oxidoreductase [Planctomycetota bacterium]|nr:oxidoreductase [Planctomycetota bacterium]